MTEFYLSILVAGVIAGAAPIVLACIGETITEKAGLINLSLDGAILLSAMAAFVVALKAESLLAGFVAGALVGAAVAAVVAVFSIFLRQNQVAVGFVLTLMTRDLAYFLGNPYSRLPGPQASPAPLAGLNQIPFLGPVLFNHPLPVYVSMALIGIAWWYIYRTSPGLELRAVGENPQAAYARGIDPRKIQMLYAVCGGLLVGLAGATFSLCTKPGWGRPQGAEGTGWIALALVIFGGWHPLKAAAGAYLFAFLQLMGIYFQGWLPTIPAQVFQVAPFPLMIFTLLVMSMAQSESVRRWAAQRSRTAALLRFLSGMAPAALGRPFRQD
ncbi:MAG: ABC transporter permease [Desulfobacterales bacterium]